MSKFQSVNKRGFWEGNTNELLKSHKEWKIWPKNDKEIQRWNYKWEKISQQLFLNGK